MKFSEQYAGQSLLKIVAQQSFAANHLIFTVLCTFY